jgi:hypothetical protein
MIGKTISHRGSSEGPDTVPDQNTTYRKMVLTILRCIPIMVDHDHQETDL